MSQKEAFWSDTPIALIHMYVKSADKQINWNEMQSNFLTYYFPPAWFKYAIYINEFDVLLQTDYQITFAQIKNIVQKYIKV